MTSPFHVYPKNSVGERDKFYEISILMKQIKKYLECGDRKNACILIDEVKFDLQVLKNIVCMTERSLKK